MSQIQQICCWRGNWIVESDCTLWVKCWIPTSPTTTNTLRRSIVWEQNWHRDTWKRRMRWMCSPLWLMMWWRQWFLCYNESYHYVHGNCCCYHVESMRLSLGWIFHHRQNSACLLSAFVFLFLWKEESLKCEKKDLWSKTGNSENRTRDPQLSRGIQDWCTANCAKPPSMRKQLW